MKFLGVLIDENLTWKQHIDLIKSKISKKQEYYINHNKFLLNEECLINIYYSFIHSYINYANIAWSSINHTKLTKG